MKALRQIPVRVRTVLLVEDETQLADLVKERLEEDGFQVLLATDGQTAIEMVNRDKPDLVVLDCMLPRKDGFSVCEELKSSPATRDTPIIFATARIGESDQLRGLEAGADDYVNKPYNLDILVARVEAVLRRTGNVPEGDSYSVGPLTVHPTAFETTLRGQSLSLTRAEFFILSTLASQPGRAFSRKELAKMTSSRAGQATTDRNVDVHILALRRKLGDFGHSILTVRGVGYKLKG